MVLEAQRAQPGADAEQERDIVDHDRDDVAHQLPPDRGVRVEVEGPVQHEAQPERAGVRERDGQPDRKPQPAVERGEQAEVDAEGEAVDHAEAEKCRRDDPRKP